MKLTDNDIKTIKNEKRMGYLFSGIILAFGFLFNLISILAFPEIELTTIALVDLLIILLCILISYFVNRKFNMDLKSGTKTIKVAQIQKKQMQTSYEAGSGALFIPILGNLFPKLWGQKMKPSDKFNLVIDAVSYEINKELYDIVNAGDSVEMNFSKHSKILLGISKKTE